VDVLLSEISKLLFSEKNLNAVLIGTGRLGRAISGYLSAEARGYHLMAAFDKSPDEIGRELQCGVMVQDVAELAAFCAAHHPDVAVLCIPRAGAKAVAPTLVEAGVKGYWNFSHYDLSVDYEGITVENVHLGDSLMSLGYRVRND
jgi:redox-sensing transcriptional repressor